MRTNTRLVLPFFYALLISACSNNDNYPKEYIGFEKQAIIVIPVMGLTNIFMIYD